MEIRKFKKTNWEYVWLIIKPVFHSGETYPYSPSISERDEYTAWIETPKDTFVCTKAQGLNSYYIGYHDANGLLILFVKILLERSGTEPFSLSQRGKPGQEVFVRVARETPDDKVSAGEQVNYSATETSTEYFYGRLNASGTSAELFLMRKEQAFRDYYFYKPNGKLRERYLLRRDSHASVWYFDEKGKP